MGAAGAGEAVAHEATPQQFEDALAAVEKGDVYMTLIFLLTGVFCFYFAILAADERFLLYFAVGTLIGLGASLVILYLQVKGYTVSQISAFIPPLDGDDSQ